MDDNDIITRKSNQSEAELPHARNVHRTSSKARLGGPTP